MQVKNSTADRPRVTLFGRLKNGRYVAEVMDEDQVPYDNYWGHEGVDQEMVYIEPDEAQLQALLHALQDGRLDYGRLQDYGGTRGGSSEFAV